MIFCDIFVSLSDLQLQKLIEFLKILFQIFSFAISHESNKIFIGFLEHFTSPLK